jgi:pSer/pThr/pTyr-binding forkhead associated (FHA) protein
VNPVSEILLLSAAVICIYLVYRIVIKQKAREASGPAPAAVNDAPAPNGGITKVLPVGMLIAKSGMNMGMVFAIEPKGIRIGRDKNKNDIVINSEMISREHAWVGLEEGKVMIKDLNSRNGTYLNSTESARISREILKDGDALFIGKAGTEVFKFKIG